MADCYSAFCDQIAGLTPKECEWIETMLEERDFWEDEEGEATKLEKRLGLTKEDTKYHDWGCWPGFQWKITPDEDGTHRLTMWADQQFNSDQVMWFARAFILQCRPDYIFSFGWAAWMEPNKVDENGGGWAVVHKEGIEWGSTWDAVKEMVGHIQTPWSNDLVQFARLISEIAAVALPGDNIMLVADSMDLDRKRTEELFDRAEKVWQDAKASLGATPEGG
jgi:hypothetical protein